MMEKTEFEWTRERSKGLFNHGSVLPVALVIARSIQVGGSFGVTEIREGLAGRAADNRIREALKKVASTGAVIKLASLGPPFPDAWERAEHPLWDFVGSWAKEAAAEPRA